MQFIKMHGIGNDYVYINTFTQTVDNPAALAPIIADRHTGVGGDGLILIMPPDAGVDAHVRMRMFNADGSEAEMCGNGIRCVCKLAYDHHVTPGIQSANPMRVQTGNGVLTLQYTTNGTGKVDQVTVDMGEPILTPEEVPVNIEGLEKLVNHNVKTLIDWQSAGDAWLEDAGVDSRVTAVSMGNPHVVFFCRDVAAVPLERIGPIIEHHRIFPNRINVHFVQVHDRSEVTMHTWERGTGITQACGTGACAVCVAGTLTDRTDRHIIAHLPGGDLSLNWKQNNHVDMTGPASEVFVGTWLT